MERFEAAFPIFKLIYTYQNQLEKIQNDLLSCAPKNSLNLFLQQIYYEISNEKNYLTTGDLYRFVKGKKIFFNVSNLIQFFSFYDLDNDYYLSLKEFANIFAFDIEPLKYVVKAELNTQVVCVFVNLLMKEMELCEQLRRVLTDFYSKNKTFNSNELFAFIAQGEEDKEMIEFTDLEKCSTEGKITKEQMKMICMKLSANSLEPISRRQFEKYFRTLSLSSNSNDLMLENSTSMMMNSSQLSVILNSAITQTKLQNESNQHKKKFEYEMFNAFIKCVINADNTLASIMATDQLFNSGTLFNLIKKSSSSFITKEDLYDHLETACNLTPSNEDMELLFEKYSCPNGNTMSFDLFNKMLKISMTKAKEESGMNESITLRFFPATTNKNISDMFRTLFQNERKIEDFRKKLNKMSHFNLREVFNDMSKGECFATSYDLSQYFSIANQDANMLVRRFDKDNDGKIGYDDFIKEMFPSLLL